MNLSDAETMARDLMTKHGVGHVSFQFDRGKSRLGVCKHEGVKNAYGDVVRIPTVIGLSRHYVELLPENEIRDVILHEIAHALALAKGDRGHGQTWKTIARSIGATGDRCATPSAAPAASVEGFCPLCMKVVMKQHRLPLRVYWHSGCGKSKADALSWFKDGKRVRLEDMPARYRAEWNAPSTGRTQTRKSRKPKTLEDFFKIGA